MNNQASNELAELKVENYDLNKVVKQQGGVIGALCQILKVDISQGFDVNALIQRAQELAALEPADEPANDVPVVDQEFEEVK
jgi:hypothetical protein